MQIQPNKRHIQEKQPICAIFSRYALKCRGAWTVTPPHIYEATLNYFLEIDESKTGSLRLANNSTTEIAGKGTIHLSTGNPGNEKKVLLSNVSHVPALGTNFLSVGKITDRGEIISNEDRTTALNQKSDVILYAEKKDIAFRAQLRGKCLGA